MKDLTFLLPAYNEEASIGLVIDEIRILFEESKILVVDNNSRDGTWSIAYGKGVDLVKCSEQGKGCAIGFGRFLVDTDYCIMVDSDLTYPPGDFLRVYGLLKEYEVVLGERQYRWSGSMSYLNKVGNKGLSLLASILYWRRFYDICSGLWGFRTPVLQDLPLTSKGFTLEADILTNVIKGGYRFTRIPVEYTPRLDGSKAKLQAWNGLQIGWFLVGRRFFNA